MLLLTGLKGHSGIAGWAVGYPEGESRSIGLCTPDHVVVTSLQANKQAYRGCDSTDVCRVKEGLKKVSTVKRVWAVAAQLSSAGEV